MAAANNSPDPSSTWWSFSVSVMDLGVWGFVAWILSLDLGARALFLAAALRWRWRCSVGLLFSSSRPCLDAVLSGDLEVGGELCLGGSRLIQRCCWRIPFGVAGWCSSGKLWLVFFFVSGPMLRPLCSPGMGAAVVGSGCRRRWSFNGQILPGVGRFMRLQICKAGFFVSPWWHLSLASSPAWTSSLRSRRAVVRLPAMAWRLASRELCALLFFPGVRSVRSFMFVIQ